MYIDLPELRPWKRKKKEQKVGRLKCGTWPLSMVRFGAYVLVFEARNLSIALYRTLLYFTLLHPTLPSYSPFGFFPLSPFPLPCISPPYRLTPSYKPPFSFSFPLLLPSYLPPPPLFSLFPLSPPPLSRGNSSTCIRTLYNPFPIPI